MDLNGDLVRFVPEDFMFHGLDPALNDVQLSLSGYWPINFEGVEDQVEFETHLSYSGDACSEKQTGKDESSYFRAGMRAPIRQQNQPGVY